MLKLSPRSLVIHFLQLPLARHGAARRAEDWKLSHTCRRDWPVAACWRIIATSAADIACVRVSGDRASLLAVFCCSAYRF